MEERGLDLSMFCQNVLFLRKKHGLSQVEMAKIMEIGVGTLRKVERGVIPPRMEITALALLANHFHISANALFLPMED